MPEHVIRLRAAWDFESVAPSAESPRRVDLPVIWSHEITAPFRLARAFQTPRIDPEHECVILRLAEVSGLTRVVLNGCRLRAFDGGTCDSELPLGQLNPGRNLLELHVDPSRWRSDRGESSGPWGTIALVIRSTDEQETNGGAGSRKL
jgi:hypothetical protein